MNKRRAVFLDRDGTINEDVGYPERFDRIRIYSYSFEAVRKINAAGLVAVIVTNQSGIGRGLFSEADLLVINEKMDAAFRAEKARLDAIYYCPHDHSSSSSSPNIDCTCRKPLPGLARKAKEAFGLDLERSYMVGDKVEDIRFGINIGAAPVLVLTGYGRQALVEMEETGIKPAYVAHDLRDAVDWILRREEERAGAD